MTDKDIEPCSDQIEDKDAQKCEKEIELSDRRN